MNNFDEDEDNPLFAVPVTVKHKSDMIKKLGIPVVEMKTSYPEINDLYGIPVQDPLPSNMIMAAYRHMFEEIPDFETEEDELTEEKDMTLENYFASEQFQADLFNMRWVFDE